MRIDARSIRQIVHDRFAPSRHAIAEAVDDDAKQPCREPRLAAKTFPFAMRLQQRILHEIFGGMRIAGQADRKPLGR
jgi:hypothetical protein